MKKGKSLLTFDKSDLQESLSEAKESLSDAESESAKSIEKAQKQLAEAKEARKQVTEAQNNIDKCSVTAPIDGIVTSISVQEGDTYSGGTILQIQDVSGFMISTTVDEYDISNVKVGQKVIILTEATGEDELEGEVTFVAPSTGSSTTSTTSQSGNGTTSMSNTTSSGSEGYEVDIKLKSADDRLKLGLTARCSIIEEEASNVFAVPYDAISQNTSGESVINISEGESGNISRKQVTVTKGMESDYYVEVQSDELQEGMNVMIPTDATDSTDSTTEEKSNSMNGLLGGGSGKRMSGGTQGGPGGGAPGGGGQP